MAPDRIEVTYRAVTPMFCGGARPASAEVRLPSFKGELRWWWRALAWSRLKGDLEKIATAESELFGSSRTGRGKVVMRLLGSSPPRVIKAGKILEVDGKVAGEGARYFGYGVMEAFPRKAKEGRPETKAGQLTRDGLQASFDLRIELRVREHDELLIDALQVIGLLGGMGAKSRRGYGSLVLQSMVVNGASCWSAPATVNELHQAIRRLLPARGRSDLPPYTALSPRMRVVLVTARGEIQPLELLDRIGREMVRYRSWGHGGKVLGTLAREESFKDDHDLMKTPPKQRMKHPRRIVFGLPHNYGQPPDQKVDPVGDRLDRRASPLLIHMHQCGTSPVAVLAMLPAQFLPDGDQALVNVGGRHVKIAPDPELWKPLGDFLDRLLSGPKEPLGEAREVRP